MGKMTKVSMLVAVMGLALAAQSAKADWVVSVVDGSGASTGTVAVGDTFQLFVTVSGSTEIIASFGMDVAPTGDAGVTFDSYALNPRAFSPLPNPNDFSDLSALHFEAGSDDGTEFGIVGGDGTLITLNITATSPGQLSLATVPDFFELDLFTIVNTTAGTPFSLTVVPEPATLALLGLGGVFAMRRRRKTA